jgi:hypothetical protein
MQRRPAVRGFSLTEVCLASLVAAMAAFLFSSGFSAISGAMEASREMDWARRLTILQVDLFQRYGTRPIEFRGADPRGIPANAPSSGWPAESWFTNLAGLPKWEMSCTVPNTPDPRPVYGRPAGAATSLDGPGAGAFEVPVGSAWHILNARSATEARWLGPADYRYVQDMGLTVRVWIQELGTTYTRSSPLGTYTVRPPGAFSPYVVEVMVLRYGIYVHSLQLMLA